jgi:PAS domain S-box-containing protein
MWVYDPQTLGFLDVNEVACSLYGWSRPEFLRLGLRDIRPHEETARVEAFIAGGVPNRSRSGPWTHRTRDGRRLPVEVVSQAVEFEGRPARLTVINDLTERLQTQQAFADSRERLVLGIDSARIGLWEWDLTTQWVQVNEHWTAMIGTTVQAFGTPTAERIGELIHPDDRAVANDSLKACFDGLSDEAEFELRFRHAEDRWIWVLSRARVVVRGPGGEPQRIIGANIDVSERKTAERHRIERELALQAIRLKSEFVVRASHELRTPLNAVLGFCQLLQGATDEPLTPRQRHRVQVIGQAGAHLLALVGDLLQLSTLEAGGLPMANEPLPINDMVAQVAELIGPLAGEQGIAMSVILAEGEPSALGDAVRLRQALLNLVSNAVKYNRRGGDVCLRAFAEDGEVGVDVVDTGVGIGAAQLEQLFEPFNRLGRHGGAVEGTGMGLAITRQLIERMRGSIEVHSVEHQGSRFSLRLPRAAR